MMSDADAVVTLVYMLLRYGSHEDGCSWGPSDYRRCDCGFRCAAEWAARAREAVRESKQ